MPLPKLKEGEIYLCGFPICTGVAIARPHLHVSEDERIPEFVVAEEEIENEVARFYRALFDSKKDLLSLQRKMKQEGGNEAAAILSSHLEIISDPLMTTEVEETIREKKKNTEFVFKTIIGEYERRLSAITNQFFRERIHDFQDISKRIMAHLSQKERVSLRHLSTRAIVFAHELSPSETAEANTDLIEAFVTRSGAETSHVAIMARAKGIPFVSNVHFPDFSAAMPSRVIVDGRSGDVIINPSKKTIAHFKNERKKMHIHVQGLQKTNMLEAQTCDGFNVRLSANIEMIDELDIFSQYGGGAVGLFRTEYLFLSQDSIPTEEEQFLVYKNVVEKIGRFPIVIRTFDIGGDKLGQVHLTRQEKNPYLGCRAIRLLLKEKNIFKIQIRAILRASAFGDVSLLFPLISGIEELREAKTLVEEVKAELIFQAIPFARNILIGCMIEVPSAAMLTDLLIKECDFLSIGTNDLVQYCLAVDRGNPTMSYLYTPAHPSILRLIQFVVKEAKKAKKPISICGEIAADPKFTALLLGLGVEEFSLSAPQIPHVKNIIRQLTLSKAQALAESVLLLSTAEEIQAALIAFHRRFRQLGED